MPDALEDYESIASIGGRTIINLRFADDIDGSAADTGVLHGQKANESCKNR